MAKKTKKAPPKKALAQPKAARKEGAVDDDLVRALAKLLKETDLTEIEYGRDGWHVRVSKQATAVSTVASVPAASSSPAPSAAASSAPASAEAVPSGPGLLRSPMVGVVYTAPDPDKPPFVKVGDRVQKGQTVVLIEAMKVFNPIEAPLSGTVSRIFINSGSPVEFDEPLLLIE
jgi:acetyl-CoA carboxylase biotin carboxyl carrier protein